uniref:Uncharacterized protein n=1 Tax=Brassica campestris TaxID=3711 RepID=M4FGW8_BRACM
MTDSISDRRNILEINYTYSRTISGNVDGKKGNAPETYGTRNGTHGDVGKSRHVCPKPRALEPRLEMGRDGCFTNSGDHGNGPDGAGTVMRQCKLTLR